MLRKLLVPLAALALTTGLTSTPAAAQATKALVYCPVSIDAVGCSAIVTALNADPTLFPGGVDGGFDGTQGTVDLASADLSGYGVFIVPSLADGAGSAPYALLRNATIAARLQGAFMGRVAVWSGTPDVGSTNRSAKDGLIRNLAKWARPDSAGTHGPGVVALQDNSDDATARYGWLGAISSLALAPDTTFDVYSNVQVLTSTGRTILTNSTGLQIGYTNMASYGLVAGGAASSSDATGGRTSRVVLVTAAGEPSDPNLATVATDKEDYQPGDSVIVTGAGWEPGETVSLLFHEDVDPPIHPDKTYTTVADADGHILNRDYEIEVTDLGVRFTIEATGQTSGKTAQATFTDNTQTVQLRTAVSPITANVSGTLYTSSSTCPNVVGTALGPFTPLTSTLVTATTANTNNRSVKLTANATATNPASSPFLNWTSPTNGAFTVVSGDPLSICIAGTNGNQTDVFVPIYRTTSTSLASSVNPSVFGQSVTFTATVSSLIGGTVNAGTVTFKDGATALGSPTVSGSGVATLATSTLSVGSHSITATYDGSGNFTTSTSAVLVQVINAVSDLTVAKSHTGNFIKNVAATYAVTVTNSGTAATSGTVTVTDVQPAGLTFTGASGTGWSCSGTTTRVCSRSDALAAGTSYPAITINVTPTAAGTVTNTATVSGGGEFNTGNNSASDPTTVDNTAPVATNDSYSVNEDQTLTVAAPGVLGNDTDANGDALTAQLQGGGTANGTLSLSADGSFSYTPNANFFGSDQFNYRASDGTNTSQPAQVSITINPVNDAPSFTKGANQSVNEGASAQTVTGWATAISAGPANESGQTLTFILTNDNNALFSVQPAVASNGTLTYTPAADAAGSATVIITLKDNGGTANGGVDTSAPQSYTITVSAINDAPSFTKGANQTVNEDAGAQTVTGWATSISAGPPDESSQTLTFQVTNNNNALFSSQPAVASNGTLTYTPAADANGSATVTVALKDDGGTANGGVDTSPPQTFTITVNPVNDAPSFTKGADETVIEGTGAHSVAGWATNISAGPANESGQVLTFQVTNNTNSALFTAGGQPAVSATGTLSYTLAATGSGAATITLVLQDDGGVANGGQNTSAAQTFVITVQPANHPPVAVDDGPYSVNEDQTLTVNAAQGVLANDTDADGDSPLTAVLVTGPAAAATASFTLNSDGSFSFQPAADFNGAVSFAYKANDGKMNSTAAATVSITVNPVNDAPSFTKGPDQTILEDAGAQTVTAWASAFSAGPANESGQTLTLTATNDNNGLFSAQPAVDKATGTLTYTPAANASGSATVTLQLKDDGGTANGGVDTYTTTFKITVTPVNDAPSFTKGADQTVNEDAGPQTLSGWATNINAGPADESGQTVSFEITNNTNAGLFSTAPAVSSTGTLTYTPAANANGGATITLRAKDNGGTANGGVDTSPTQTFTITVNPVNDAPSFTQGADQTVLEDAGAQSVPSWASAFSAGPADESGQTLMLTATNDNNALFSVQPSVDKSTGTLTYTPAADANGFATVTLELKDDGGTANGGVDTYTTTFKINVTAVNDAPSFTKGADQTVNEDAGLQTVSGWATNISAGPANESGQTVMFVVSANTNAGLFTTAPAVSSTGILTYQSASDANGTATITLHAKDDGGTADGGVDLSADQTFTITVRPVNDAPSFTKGPDQTVLEDAGAQIVTAWASAFSAGPADESGQTLTLTATNDNNALFSAQPSVDKATGNLTYTPAANANGSATVTLTLKDNGGTAYGGVDTYSTTFTITVTAVNDAPSFTKGLDQTVNEGAGAQNVPGWATALSKGPPDESGQTLTFTVTNDNNALFTVQPAVDGTGKLTFTPASGPNGSATVTVVLKDNGGTANGGVDTSAPQTFVIAVSNVAPTVANATATPNLLAVGTSVNASGSFTDPGVGDTHTASIAWGDGATTPGTVNESGGNGSVSGSHVYVAAGVYSITVTVTDNDAGSGSAAYQYVVVYDPSAGFVTGGGWINSPLGAYVIDPTLTGKANFGFVSKYLKGANVPTGNTEFQFHAAGLNFKSTVYEWLVVSGGSKASYKGSGTINGSGNFGFLLSAVDASSGDKFRIKIWDKATSAVVYDNQMNAGDDALPTTVIAGGSIVVQTNGNTASK